MQSEELARLMGIGELNETGGGSRANVIKLTEKVDEIRFQYMEKDREVQVLRNEIQVQQESSQREIVAYQEEIESQRESLTLLKREADALREGLD